MYRLHSISPVPRACATFAGSDKNGLFDVHGLSRATHGSRLTSEWKWELQPRNAPGTVSVSVRILGNPVYSVHPLLTSSRVRWVTFALLIWLVGSTLAQEVEVPPDTAIQL